MWTYAEREQTCSHPLNRHLLAIMQQKQSNLGVAADVTTSAELLTLADKLGPHICLFKTHIDIIDDFSWDTIEQLCKLAEQNQFVLFEDRKFADIGHTVKLQYSRGVYRIAEWAQLTTVHTLPGPGILDGLREDCLAHGNGLLLLAGLSSKGTLTDDTYQQASMDMAQANPDIVSGIICQHRPMDDPNFLYLSPGVKLAAGGDDLGQQYRTPEMAIVDQGCDIILVGRGIIASDTPAVTAQAYQQAGWQAYQNR